MRKLQLLTKMLLVSVLLGMSGSVWADPIETVGNADCSTTDLTDSSTPITLTNGKFIHYTFSQNRIDGGAWNNMNGYHLIVNDGNEDIIVMRPDAWENKAGKGDGFTTSWSDWDAWRADMDGSTVDMYVSLNGTSFSMTANITGKSSATYTYSYNKTLSSSPASLDIRLSVHYAYLQITAADLSNTVTYDFTSYSNRTLENSGTKAFSGASVNANYASNLAEVHNRFAFQFAGTFSIENDGLYAQRTNGDHVGIVGMQKGDKVKINFTPGAIMVRGGVPDYTGITTDWTNYTSGTQITLGANTNFLFQAKTLCKISSIIIETVKAETVTAPSIDSEAAGDERTVTITDGVSNLLSGVKTYYTIDGSIPTASSTLYTGPFNISETATVKAITISNSSAATPSAVTTQLIDMDVIDVPTAAISAVDGINRTVTFSCTTEGVTLYYSIKDGEDWGAYVEGNSVVISANTTLKVKATKNTKEAVSDELSFQAGTAIKLNNPSYTIGAYSAGAYTLTLTSTQTDKLLSPTAVIKYTENDGETQTINSGETVNASVGSTYKFWSYVEGYTNSDEVTAVPTYVDVTSYRQDWSNDFKALAEGIIGSGSDNYNKQASLTLSGENLVAGYYNITNAGFHSNFGVNNVVWQVRYYGATKEKNTGLWPYNVNGSMVITDLSAGDVIVFTGDAVTAGTNVSKDVFTSSANGNSTFVVSADGNATFTPTKSGYIYSVTVYTKRPENVTPTISAVGWATYCSEYALDFTGVTALTAYTASVVGTTVTFNKVSGKVPANTGLLISGETASVPVCASADPVANIMEGVTKETVKSANTIFVLKKGASGLGFYKNANDFTLRAHSAYIPATNIPATARGFISLDDEATGIKGSLTPALSEGERVFYNLNGCKLQSVPTKKGVYLFNGKKVVVK